jgi:hypothetical protein
MTRYKRGHSSERLETTSIRPKFHVDGSVTYWSVYDQSWRTSWIVPDRELAAMPEAERMRVLKHLNGVGKVPEES